MALPDDLLEQARLLIRKEPKKPKQASLKRGVSSAYYALFHLLTDASARMLVGGGKEAQTLRSRVRRAFSHTDMKKAATELVHANKQPADSRDSDILYVAKAFIDMQQARHEADYAADKSTSRSEAMDLLLKTEDAFVKWRRIRRTAEAREFLTALLLCSRWRR